MFSYKKTVISRASEAEVRRKNPIKMELEELDALIAVPKLMTLKVTPMGEAFSSLASITLHKYREATTLIPVQTLRLASWEKQRRINLARYLLIPSIVN